MMPSGSPKTGERGRLVRAVFIRGPWDGSTWRIPDGRPTPFVLARLDSGAQGTTPTEIGRYNLLRDEHTGRPSVDGAGRYRYCWTGMDDVDRYAIARNGRAIPREVSNAKA